MKNKREYPKNLIYDLFGEDKEIEITKDILDGVEYAINQLDEEQTKIINQYYKNNLTLNQISESLNTSRQNIFYKKTKILRKLRKPKLLRFIINGYEVSKTYLETKTIDNLDISYIDISVRAYNCLKRSGINNVNEIKSINQLKSVKCLGGRGISEIVCELEKHGRKLPQESE